MNEKKLTQNNTFILIKSVILYVKVRAIVLDIDKSSCNPFLMKGIKAVGLQT